MEDRRAFSPFFQAQTTPFSAPKGLLNGPTRLDHADHLFFFFWEKNGGHNLICH